MIIGFQFCLSSYLYFILYILVESRVEKLFVETMEKDEEENSFERNDSSVGARLEYYFSTKKINPF